MIEWFSPPHPVSQALLAGVFTWGITAIGASIVFCIRTLKRSVLDGMPGFAAGVVIAASYWTLLSSAIEMDWARGDSPRVGPLAWFLCGAGALWIGDALEPHHPPRACNHHPQHHRGLGNELIDGAPTTAKAEGNVPR